MVNLDTTRRVTANLYYAGKQFLSSSIHGNHHFRLSGDSQDPQAAHSTEYLVHNWLEALFSWIQMVVLWHDPALSLCAITGLSISFLLLIYFAPRLYATILIMIFVYNMTKVWFRHVWPEIRIPVEPEKEEESRLDVDRWTYLHPQLMTLKELSHLRGNLIKSGQLLVDKLLDFRCQKPTTFAITICSALSCTAYIGNRVDGLTLLFVFTLLAVSAPGIYLHLLPESTKRFLNLHVSPYLFQGLQTAPEPENNEPNQETEAESTAALETSDPTPSKLTTISSALSSPLSLYDHLMRFGFGSDNSAGQTGPSSALLSKSNPVNESSKTAQGPTEPIEHDSSADIAVATKMGALTASTATAPLRKVSEDLSSIDESTSLIDFEDDQQDGFVIL